MCIHTYVYKYIYIYICICVCVCLRFRSFSRVGAEVTFGEITHTYIYIIVL